MWQFKLKSIAYKVYNAQDMASMMDMECMLYIRTRIPMLVKRSSVRARSDWLAGGGSDVSGKVAPLPNPPGLVWSPTPQPQGLALPLLGKAAATVFSRPSASVASRCLHPHKCSHKHLATPDLWDLETLWKNTIRGIINSGNLSTMASSSSSPVRLTSSPLEASRSPSPPKTSLGKRRASFLDKSIELKQKSLLLSSAGLTSSLGLTLPSSVGISPPSPRILLRPEVAAYLARGLSQFPEQHAEEELLVDKHLYMQ